MKTTARTPAAAADADRTPPSIVQAGARSLRVGFAEVRPWSYRAERTMQGLDVAAIEHVAIRLGRSLEYHARPPADLATGLLDGAYEIAIGGLLPDPHREIVAIAVPHAQVWACPDEADRRARIRRVFFPNVWWVRRADLGLRLRVRLLLLAWRWSKQSPTRSAMPGPLHER